MSKRILFYYQSTTSLTPIIKKNPEVTDILISSVHFGYNKDGSPYIHLNNWNPDDSRYDQMWEQTSQTSFMGIRIGLMIGGAGTAYGVLFSNFDKFYPLLRKTIERRPWITGIDLDIEEEVKLEDIRMLMRTINTDFGNRFRITMAPVAYSLETDDPGMGGFSYKELYNSEEGKLISWFNAQCYGCFNEDTYQKIISNGYPAHKVVMGMLSEDVKNNFDQTLNILTNLSQKEFGGTYIWEYFDAPYGIEWARLVYEAMHRKVVPVKIEINKNFCHIQ